MHVENKILGLKLCGLSIDALVEADLKYSTDNNTTSILRLLTLALTAW